MDSEQFRVAAHAAVEQIAEYYDTVQDRERIIANVQPGYLRPLLPDAAPEEGESWPDIQKDLEAKIVPGLTHWQSPNFMAFFPSNSTFPAMLGEMYSAAYNAPAFNWICSPAVTELETIVLDWMAKAWNLPTCYHSSTEGGGVISGTASEAVVTAIIAARDRYMRKVTANIADDKEREDAFYTRRGKLIALGSEMSHSGTQKGAQIAGVRYRSVPVDEDGYAMTGPKIRKVVEQCITEGLEPFFITATLGTTATCAIDDFEGLAAVVQDHLDLWVHVDAAYAGAALVCPEYQHLTKHFDKFDSFNVNMHKWLLTNFDASCFYVKERKSLTDTLSITPSYLRNAASESGLVTDYRDWQIPLGRRFRSLKIWFVARTYGIKGMQSYIRKHVKIGEYFAGLVESKPDLFRIVAGPIFALTVFYVKTPEGASGVSKESILAEENRITREVYEAINAEGRFMLTSTMLGQRYVIRVISATPRTEEEHLKNVFDKLVQTAEEVRGK